MGFGDVKAGAVLGAALGLVNSQIAVLAYCCSGCPVRRPGRSPGGGGRSPSGPVSSPGRCWPCSSRRWMNVEAYGSRPADGGPPGGRTGGVLRRRRQPGQQHLGRGPGDHADDGDRHHAGIDARNDGDDRTLTTDDRGIDDAPTGDDPAGRRGGAQGRDRRRSRVGVLSRSTRCSRIRGCTTSRRESPRCSLQIHGRSTSSSNRMQEAWLWATWWLDDSVSPVGDSGERQARRSATVPTSDRHCV